MQVPILTYHGNNINGTEYHNNDLIALAEDLNLLHDLGYQIISLSTLIKWHAGDLPDHAVERAVVLTCDDGTWFDFYDVEHPHHGHQISIFNLLKSHQSTFNQPVHISNFVIVSPEARKILDKECLIGKGWWTDEWWQQAQSSNLMSIENHSWDHNHGVLDNNNVNDDTFTCIDDKASCDVQLKQAQAFIKNHFNGEHTAQYFAYPYGNYSDYIRYQYLPHFGHKIGLEAALTTEPKHVSRQSDLWALPRYVCNNDWHEPSELQKLLHV